MKSVADPAALVAMWEQKKQEQEYIEQQERLKKMEEEKKKRAALRAFESKPEYLDYMQACNKLGSLIHNQFEYLGKQQNGTFWNFSSGVNEHRDQMKKFLEALTTETAILRTKVPALLSQCVPYEERPAKKQKRRVDSDEESDDEHDRRSASPRAGGLFSDAGIAALLGSRPNATASSGRCSCRHDVCGPKCKCVRENRACSSSCSCNPAHCAKNRIETRAW